MSRTDEPRLQQPLECDLIMKGGITSGIVYPGAIYELSKFYRLRAIGGASAGAIAAACAAAAEYRRTDGNQIDAFESLNKLPNELATPVQGELLLLRLFKAEPETRNVLRWFLAGLSGDATPGNPAKFRAGLRWLSAALRFFPIFAMIGIAVGSVVVLGVSQATEQSGSMLRLLGAMFGLFVGALLVVVALLLGIMLTMRRVLPENMMGLVSGMGSAADPALTPWLNSKIQSLAGLSPEVPLTFGALWQAGKAPATPDNAANQTVLESSDRRIDLRVMATALSHGKAYSFPLEPEDRFYFDPSEFRRLFPSVIVEHLLNHGRTPSGKTDGQQVPNLTGKLSVDERLNVELIKRGLQRLPTMADMPILVPVRMSLSFPFLLSAVPLYRKRFLADENGVIERVWFSDGGIVSNFPIHFFDSIIPTRPTFGINLSGSAGALSATNSVELPKTNSVTQPEWIDIEIPDAKIGQDAYLPSPIKFIASIFTTMHDWNDATQIRVPGFKDRIATIRLGPGEGGINLRMRSELILELAERGRRAGLLLCSHFVPSTHRNNTLLALDPSVKTTWNNHRWVRFRTAAKLLEEAFAGLRVAEEHTANDPSAIFSLHANQPSYPMDQAQRGCSIEAYKKLLELADWFDTQQQMLGHAIYDKNSPKPNCQLRIRPRT